MSRVSKTGQTTKSKMSLRNYLDRNNMTQKEFCARVGIEDATLSRWCSGQTVPSLFHGLLVETATGGAVGLQDWLSQEQVNRVKVESLSERPPIRVEEMAGLEDVLNARLTMDKIMMVNPDFDAELAFHALRQIDKAIVPGNPSLSDCAPESIIGALMRCAAFDLYPIRSDNFQTGHGLFVVPFRNVRRKCHVATVRPSWPTLAGAVFNGGWARDLRSDVVRADCEFEYENGLTPVLRHVPGPGREKIIGAWAVVDGPGDTRRSAYLGIDRITGLALEGKGVVGNAEESADSPGQKICTALIMRQICGYLPQTLDLVQLLQRFDASVDESNLLLTGNIEARVEIMAVERKDTVLNRKQDVSGNRRYRSRKIGNAFRQYALPIQLGTGERQLERAVESVIAHNPGRYGMFS